MIDTDFAIEERAFSLSFTWLSAGAGITDGVSGGRECSVSGIINCLKPTSRHLPQRRIWTITGRFLAQGVGIVGNNETFRARPACSRKSVET